MPLDSFTLSVLIFLLVIGPAVGNYACSVVYRLPRGKTPFERHPFCGHCNADLKPIDLFPILSWLSTRGRCRYCGGVIPGIYTVIELACGALMIAYFLRFGMGEPFLLYSATGVFTVMLWAICWQQGWISVTLYSYALLLLALARVTTEHSIYPLVGNAILMLVVALPLARLWCGRAFQPFALNRLWWLVLMAAATPPGQWLPLALATLPVLMAPSRWGMSLAALATLALPLF